MLVSHRKKFIATKGQKTAGTSVESFFERYCVPEGTWEERHTRETHVSESGIIGHRGRYRKKPTWRNHMSAKEIRDLIGRDTWDAYYKFTVIRNPFDKLVSLFYWIEQEKKNYSLKRKGRALVSRFSQLGNPINRITGDTDIERFRSWIRQGGTLDDRDTYLMDGEECLDFYIRFEELHEGLRQVCEHLSIPYEPENLPEFKMGIRNNLHSCSEFYDAETEALVQERFEWEFATFGYGMPKA